MNPTQHYANYIANANARYAEGIPLEDAFHATLPLEVPLIGLESPLIDPDPNEGIRVSLSAPLAATKNGIGYLQILVHLTGVEDEGGTFPSIAGAVHGFDNFQFKIGGGPGIATLSRPNRLITEDMRIFSAKNRVGAWLKDRKAAPITKDGIITGFQFSRVPAGPYRISLLSFAIGNGKFNDEFDGVAGTNTHHAETWPNTPYIDVIIRP